jgi:hypothetical protein
MHLYPITEYIVTRFIVVIPDVPISELKYSIHSLIIHPPAECCLDYKHYKHE